MKLHPQRFFRASHRTLHLHLHLHSHSHSHSHLHLHSLRILFAFHLQSHFALVHCIRNISIFSRSSWCDKSVAGNLNVSGTSSSESECGGYHSVLYVEPFSVDPDRTVAAVLAHHRLADAGNHHAQSTAAVWNGIKCSPPTNHLL